MARVKDIGELDWNIEDSSGDELCFILRLDRPPVNEGEVDESVAWDPWTSATTTIVTRETRVELHPSDPKQHDLLRLPRDLRAALASLSLYIAGTVLVAYSWRGGRRVDIRISRFPDKIRRPTAFLRYLAKKLMYCMKLRADASRLEELMYVAGQSFPIPTCPSGIVQEAIRRARGRQSDAAD